MKVAKYMTKYQQQAEHAHAQQAMWLANLFARLTKIGQ